jgi:hypothetical protein
MGAGTSLGTGDPVLLPGAAEACPEVPPLSSALDAMSDIPVSTPPSTVAMVPTGPAAAPKKKTRVLSALTTHCAMPPDVAGKGLPRSGPADE